ncbi:hypothetical protein GQ457_13G016780 [Hibiscus cannabinus]
MAQTSTYIAQTDRFIQKTYAFMDKTKIKLQNQDATLKSLETQVGQISQIVNTRPICEFPSDTEVAKGATHEQCKARATSSGEVLEPTNKQRSTVVAHKKTLPFTDTPATADKPADADEDHIDPTDTREVGTTAEASQPEQTRSEKLENIRPPPPFPQMLKKQKQDYQFKKFFDILKQTLPGYRRAIIDFDKDEIALQVDNNQVKMKVFTVPGQLECKEGGKAIQNSPSKCTQRLKPYMGAHIEMEK